MRQFFLAILYTSVSSYNLAKWTPVERSELVILDSSDATPSLESFERPSDDYGDNLPLQRSAQCTSINHSAECNLLKGLTGLAEKTFSLTKAWLDSLDVGSEVDCLDFDGDWFVATVVKVHENKWLLKVRNQDWTSNFEEWIHRYSGRITKHSVKTTQLRSSRRVSYTAESMQLVPIYVEGLSAEERSAAKLHTDKARIQHFKKKEEKKREKKLEIKGETKMMKLETETHTIFIIYEGDDDIADLPAELPMLPELPTTSSEESESSELDRRARFLDIIDPERKFNEYVEFLDKIRSGEVKEVDALDFQGYWWTAKVTILLANKDEVNISFDQWIPLFDEFIPISSGKLAPHKTKAKGGRMTGGVKGEPLYPDKLANF